MDELVRLRPMEPDDIPFVASSWIRSYSERGRTAQGMEYAAQMDGHGPIVDEILRRATTRATIACYPQQPKLILGWVVTEGTSRAAIVHYVYVKQNYRRNGFAKKLLECMRGLKLVLHTHEIMDDEEISEPVSRLIKLLGSKYNHYKR